jgi:AraC-like DNA-binding protein
MPAASSALKDLLHTLAVCDLASGTDHAGGFYRSGVITSAPEVLRQFGADPAATARAAGLDPLLPTSIGERMTFAQLGRYLEQCVTDSGCNEFGLLAGINGRLDRIGPVGQLMRHAPTLGIALQDLAMHQMRFARGATVFIHRLGDETLVGYTVHQPDIAGRDQISAAGAAFGASIIRELAPGVPFEVHLAQAPPADRRLIRRYEAILGCKVHFDADFTSVALLNEHLGHRIAGADKAERARLLTEVKSYWPMTPPSICYMVFRTLIAQIAAAKLSLDETASALALHPRTLERRLEEEGTSFTMIREAARFEIARQLLSGTRLSMTAISLAIGYAQPAAFSRSFRKWAGVSPHRYRRVQAPTGTVRIVA